MGEGEVTSNEMEWKGVWLAASMLERLAKDWHICTFSAIQVP